MRLPTAEEINPDDDPWDGATAVKNFLGKSLSEAEALFSDHQSNGRYFEDLWYMGPRAFCYYVPAALSSFRTKSEYGNMLNYFCSCIEWHLAEHKNELTDSFPILREALQSILDRWGTWGQSDARTGLYDDEGELKGRYIHLLENLG